MLGQPQSMSGVLAHQHGGRATAHPVEGNDAEQDLEQHTGLSWFNQKFQ